MTGTPWAEYERLAEEIRGGRPHHGEGGNVGDVSALPFHPPSLPTCLLGSPNRV